MNHNNLKNYIPNKTVNIKGILNWFEVAIPEPKDKDVCVQVGVHLEECAEMLHALGLGSASRNLHSYADMFKRSDRKAMYCIEKADKVELLDSIADQIVTGVGTGHMLGMDIEGALKEVNDSNHSKFEYGKAVFDEQGKISKGKNYRSPELEPFIGNN